MVDIKKLTKKYGDNIGNFDISLKIPAGQVYGIIGPNGAGKTTLIRQIMGYVKPDSGYVKINNLNPFKKMGIIMKFTGYVAGEVSLHNELKGTEYLKIVFDFKQNSDWSFVEKLIKHFDIDTNIKIKKMSKGMKQKIALISAVMHKPKFLVLDEPTSGLDPIIQDQFNDLIFMMKNEYKSTIIICSHIFQEIAKLCDKVGIIKNGRLIQEFEMKNKTLENIEDEFKKIYKKENILNEQ